MLCYAVLCWPRQPASQPAVIPPSPSPSSRLARRLVLHRGLGASGQLLAGEAERDVVVVAQLVADLGEQRQGQVGERAGLVDGVLVDDLFFLAVS